MKLSVTEHGLKENKTPREKTAIIKPRVHPQIILFTYNWLYHNAAQECSEKQSNRKMWFSRSKAHKQDANYGCTARKDNHLP